MKIAYRFTLALSCLLGFTQCENQKTKSTEATTFESIQGSDTIRLALNVYEKSFYGEYEHTGKANYRIVGVVEGERIGDTLKGNLLYTPHGWKTKKRRAFLLLNQKESYLEGKGSEVVYMGFPYFLPETVVFDAQHPFVLKK